MDQRSFENLFKTHFPALMAFSRRILGDEDEAPPQRVVQGADGGADHQVPQHRPPGDPENGARHQLLDVLGMLRQAIGDELHARRAQRAQAAPQ